ncbi:MAG: hypothetical protein JXR05_04790 [Flavobacteriaceae bacterium]
MKPPHIKAKKEKEFRKILKRLGELYQAKQDLGYIKLEQPIRHGWYKEVILTRSVEKYKNSEAIKEVYQKIKASFWGVTKEKAQLAWDEERSRYGLVKDKPTISPKSYRKLSDKAKDLCVVFKYKVKHQRKLKTRFYINFPKGCTKIKFTRAYITHRKRIDPTLESEFDFLQGTLLKPTLFELNSKGYWNRWSRMSKSFERKNEAHRVKERLSTYRNNVISEDLKRLINNEQL